MSDDFRYRLIGGFAHWRTVRLAVLSERVEIEPNGTPNRFLRRSEMYFLIRLTGQRGVMLAESCLPRLTARQSIRRDIARHIVRHHRRFLLCEICGALQPRLVVEHAPYCPHCHGYLFTARPASIRRAAAIVGTRPPAWLTPHFDL